MKRTTKWNTPIDLMLPEWIVDEVLEVYDGEDAERELLRILSTGRNFPHETNREKQEQAKLLNGMLRYEEAIRCGERVFRSDFYKL